MGILYQQSAPVINFEGALFQTTAVYNYHVCYAAKMKIKTAKKVVHMTCVAFSKIIRHLFCMKHNTKPDASGICKT